MNFLGISKSYTNKEWVGPSEQNLQQALAYSKSLSIPHLSALQLIKNKINEGDYLDYISPKIKNLIPSPKIFLDMEKGSLRLRRALEQKESVAIFADYDVDGTVSAALISLWLRNFSIEPTVYIPDRETEGFGPNIDAMNKLALNHSLIICVDCGTDSEEAIRGATERGVDVIVIDHHKSDTFSKSAYAIINPNRFDEKNIFPYLCAAGVVFIFLVEMNRIIPKSRSSEINLLSYLNLVSLATVADVVPLIGLNRAFVKQGLKIFQNRLCLKMFGTHFNLLQNFNEETIAFQVAPRLNASGRIDTAYLTYQFLTATDPKSIEIYLNKMEAANKERKALEKIILSSAVQQISNAEKQKPYTLVKAKGWHKGVIGIIASRLKDLYGGLCVVITIDGDVGHGSIRSTEEIDLTEILQELKSRDVLISGGGHKQAAGFSLLIDRIEEFDNIVTNHLSDHTSLKNSSALLEIDGMIDIEGVNTDLIDKINLLGPFGSQVPQPIIVIPSCQLLFVKELGEGHLLCKLKKEEGTLDAICFNAKKKGLDIPLSKPNQILHLAGNLVKNEWNGVTKPQMRIVDIAKI